MADFFSIGMTRSEAMSKLDTTQATDKTKQYIQNFWNTDKDGKVTNEIELAMLNSWASGSEKVKMPTKGKGNKPIHTDIFGDGSRTEIWESKSNKRPIPKDYKSVKYDSLNVVTGDLSNTSWNDGKAEDVLLDLNGDGYADKRKYFENWQSVNPSHIDKNMDGNLLDIDI